MKNECGKIHFPSFSKTCCLRHLLEMSNFSQKQTLTKKYTKLLLLTLNHSHKENLFNFSEIKLDLLIFFLDVICKYMGHFYMVQKYEYTKLLGIIATKALKETDYKQHPEIILRECAINNNIACLYEAKKKYNQAYKYLSNNKKYIEINNDFDNAVLYNNLIRLCFKSKKLNEVTSYIVNLRVCLQNAIIKMKNIQIYKAFENGNFIYDTKDYSAKNELISLLMFNLGMMYDRLEEKQNAKEIYLQGYEFSLSSLGEWNFNTQRLKSKIIMTVSVGKKEGNEKKQLNCISNKNSLNHSTNENDDAFSFKNSTIFQNNSKNNGNDSNISQSKKQNLKDKSLIDKINRICEFIEKYGNKLQQPKISNNNLQIILKKERRHSSYDVFKQMSKPYFSNIFQSNDILTGKKLCDMKSPSKNYFTADALEDCEKDKSFRNKSISYSNHRTRHKHVLINLNDSTFINKKETNDDSMQFIYDKINETKKEELISYRTEGEVKNSSNIVFDEQIINNEVSSPINSPRVVIQIPNMISPHTENVPISARNILKPELQELSKKISCHIEYENNHEAYEFKPFYKKGNTYKRIIASFDPQKKVNFIKSQGKTAGSFLGNLLSSSILEVPKSPKKYLKKPKKKLNNAELKNQQISVIPTESARYEFQPYYNHSDTIEDESQLNTSQFCDSSNDNEQSNKDKNNNNVEQKPLNENKKTAINKSQNQNAQNKTNEFEMKIQNVDNVDNHICITSEIHTNEQILSSLSDSCIYFVDDFDFDYNINFYFNHSKNDIDIYSYFEQLLSITHKKKIETKQYVISLPFLNETYSIMIKNESSQQKLQFSLYQNTSQQSIYSPINVLCIDYTKLNKIIQKLHIINSIPSYYDINQFENFDDLIQKLISNHTIIIKKENLLSIGLSAKPSGINGDKQITFRFLKSQCTIDIIVLSKNKIRIIVGYLKSIHITLNIDCICDDSSFDSIAKEIEIKNETFLNSDEYLIIPSYQFNPDQIGKLGFIPAIMKKIQAILKVKYSEGEIEGYDASISHTNTDKENSKVKQSPNGKDTLNNSYSGNDISLVKVYTSLNEIMFKCIIKNSGKDISIMFLNLKPKTMKFNLELYDKSETNIQPISFLKDCPIDSIFDCFSSTESKLMYEKISDREQTILKYIIINNYIYNDNNQIKEVQQENLFSFMFMPEGNDSPVVLSFTFNKFIENICYFGKLISYDTTCQGLYSIIFLPREQDMININKMKETLSKNKNRLKLILFKIYLGYIKESQQRTIDTQDMKPLKKFLPLAYILNQCN